jgi:beta-phosphoglucomutase-like phosphatase (HAD superfamily)
MLAAMLQAVVFDFDGVLVDSEPMHYRAFLRIAREQGFDYELSYERYIEVYIGFDDRDMFRHLLSELSRPADEALVRRLIDAKEPAFAAEVNKAARDGTLAIAGSLKLARHLWTQGVPIAIGSGATRADIALMLEALGLGEAFPIRVTADDVQRSKPDPVTYVKAAWALGFAPSEVLAIEDTPAGLTSAKAAGLRRLGLTTTHRAEQLKLAERIVDDLGPVTWAKLQEWFTG